MFQGVIIWKKLYQKNQENENKGGKIIYKEDTENVFFLALHASYIIKILSVRGTFSN